MARYVFKLPDVGEGTAEAEIVAWHVKVGQMIDEDAPLVDVMTDKATVEMTSPVAGRILEIFGELGAMAPVGSALVTFELGEAAAAVSETPPSAAQTQEATPGLPRNPSQDDPSDKAAELDGLPTGAKPLASPAVRRRADALGMTLADVGGTGPGGRIEHADIDALLTRAGPQAPASSPSGLAWARPEVETVKIIGLRRKIAEKMQTAKRRIPHFSYIEELDMTALEELRAYLNGRYADRVKLTVLPFFMRALVRALPDFPQINARFDDDEGVVRRYAAVHIGVATQTAGGLLVPVVRNAQRLDLWQAAAEVARLSQAARAAKAKPDELEGGTITLTSLGPLGGVATTPVINHPEVAIVGPNKIVERPVVRAGKIEVRKMMNLSASFDHRVVDGYDAAAFIQAVKLSLETPAALFVD